MLCLSAFNTIVNNNICFRESAKICKLAKETDSKIKIAYKNKEANSDSILSLVNLGLTSGSEIVFSILSNNYTSQKNIYHKLLEIFK